MIRSSVRIVCLASLLTWQSVSYAAEILTTGEAQLQVPADQVAISFAVTATKDSAEAARQEVDQIIKQASQALEKELTDSDRLEASHLRLEASYEYQDRKRVFVGYKAERSMVVELADLSQLGKVLDLVMSQGINQVSHLSYRSSKEQQHRQQVRAMAIEDSYQKAEQLAAGYRGRLGPVKQVAYKQALPMPVYKAERALASADASGGNSYTGAQLSYFDTVNVSFELITE